jgi:hypothetical protein
MIQMRFGRGEAVHHVAEEAVEELEASLVRQVRRFEPEVPLADDARVITGLP